MHPASCSQLTPSAILATSPANSVPHVPTTRRRSSSSTAAKDNDHSVKTRSGLAAATLAAGAGLVSGSKLDPIEDEADSNSKLLNVADVSTSTASETTKDNSMSDLNQSNNSSGNNTPSGVNRRTNFFKRNKSNLKIN